MQKLTTEAQRTQSFSWEMFLCDLCASVVRNLHQGTGKLFRTYSLVSLTSFLPIIHAATPCSSNVRRL